MSVNHCRNLVCYLNIHLKIEARKYYEKSKRQKSANITENCKNPSLKIFVMRSRKLSIYAKNASFFLRSPPVKISLYIIRLWQHLSTELLLACFVLSSFYIVGIISGTVSLSRTVNLFTDERFYLIFPTVSSFDCRKSFLSFLNILLTRWVWVWCGGGAQEAIYHD